MPFVGLAVTGSSALDGSSQPTEKRYFWKAIVCAFLSLFPDPCLPRQLQQGVELGAACLCVQAVIDRLGTANPRHVA